jgi:F-box-like
MSLSPTNSANRLHEDVLLVIFDQLDDQDLLRCETVCRQWRNILLSGRPWRTLFHRKIVSSEKWRKVWRDFGVNEENLQSLHYRGICRVIIREMNKIDNNWRNGNFKKTSTGFSYSSHNLHGAIGYDYIALTFKHWG